MRAIWCVVMTAVMGCGAYENTCPTESPTHGGDCSNGQACGPEESCIDLGAGVKGCFRPCDVNGSNQCMADGHNGTCTASSVGIGYCMSWICE